jgi:LmbE family N-acetylglucosaminyl deacetylase
VTAALLIAMWLTAGAAAAGDAVPPQPLDFRPDAATRLLVVAPHPDDETLGAAGLMQRVLGAGGSVRLVMMTGGDAFPEGVEASMHIRRPRPRDFRRYGDLRQAETTAAMQQIGLSRSQILFLGFPDGGLCLIAAKYLSAKAKAFDSPYTNRSQPPPSEQLIRGVRYRGADIRRELERVLLTYRPTMVVLPYPEDDHPDHCASGIFVREGLDALKARHRNFSPRVVSYLVHHGQWPLDLESLSGPLAPPSDFPPDQGEWKSLTLTPEEAQTKQRLLTSGYLSQQIVIGVFLRAFSRPNELFLEGRSASPPECWCDEKNVATELPPAKYRRRPAQRR